VAGVAAPVPLAVLAPLGAVGRGGDRPRHRSGR
jgi:hypothetical protein